MNGLSFGSGCRCCYDPNTDGGDYELLASAKEEFMASFNEGGEEDAIDERTDKQNASDKNCDDHDDDDDDSSDDGEFDYLLDDDISGSEFDLQRRAELENLAQRTEVLRHHGYGVHRQMHPHRLFAAAGYGIDTMRDVVRPKGSVIHLFDAYSPRSVALDLYLERIASKYPGTKFVRGIGVASMAFADGGSGDDAWKRGNLPMLLALKEGKVEAWNAGLKDFFSSENLETRVLEQWLDRAGVLVETLPSVDEVCRIRPEETALLENMMKLNRLGDGGLEQERYNCGVAGCCKSFHHEHVGVKTEEQNGLLVTEDQVFSMDQMLCQEIS